MLYSTSIALFVGNRTVKKKVGIVPSGHYLEGRSVYDDAYTVVNAYGNSVRDAGAFPVGIVPQNAHIDEDYLSMCDAFLITGGIRILPYHLETVAYAKKTGKKLLGICLGMQAIHAYFFSENERRKRGSEETAIEVFERLKREGYMYLDPVDGHWAHHMERKNLSEVRQPVFVNEGTVKRIFGKTEITAPSMHRYAVNVPDSCLRISAAASDGVVEGLEYGNNILGVQFHPEIDPQLALLFTWLCEL